jgi:hypothetical protein
MRRMLLMLLLVKLCSLTALPQKKKITPSTRLDCVNLSLPVSQNEGSFFLPFSFIEVVDARPDSTKLGFQRDRTFNACRIYCTKTSPAQEIQQWFNTYCKKNLDSNSTNRLLVCIKKFWISDFDKSELKTADKNQRFDNIYYKAEIYYKVGDQYYPVRRIDSVFAMKRRTQFVPPTFVEQVFKYTVSLMQETDWAAMAKKRSVERQRIDSFNRSIALPVLNDTGYRKGVFVTFAEFKNNRPSYTEFELKTGRLSDILYVTEADGKSYVKRDVWGFFDGKNLFIRMGINFFPLHRQNQTWEFFGTNNLEQNDIRPIFPTVMNGSPVAYFFASAAMDATGSISSTVLNKLRPFQVDIETGEMF